MEPTTTPPQPPAYRSTTSPPGSPPPQPPWSPAGQGPAGAGAPAPPATLVDFWAGETKRCEDAVARVKPQIDAAQQAVAGARTALADHVKALAAAEAVAASIRKNLNSAPAPGDLEKLIVDLEAAMMKIHGEHGAIRTAQEDLAEHTASLQQRQAAVNRATARLGEAKTAFTAAQAAEKTHQAWKEQVAGPLADLPKLAADLKQGDAAKKAQAWAALIPQKLQTAATARLNAAHTRLDGLQDLTGFAETWLAKAQGGGSDGQLATLRLEYGRAEAAVRDYVRDAKQRLDGARNLIEGVGNAAPITAEEKKKLDELVAKSGPPSDLDTVRAKLLGDVDDAEVKCARATLKAQAGDSLADVTGDADVKKAQGDLDKARAELDKKEKEIGARDEILRWSTQLPDAAWQRFLEYQEALRQLDPWPDAGKLVLNLVEAEKKLATALAKDAPAIGAVTFWTDALAARKQEATAAENDRPSALLSALRGDR